MNCECPHCQLRREARMAALMVVLAAVLVAWLCSGCVDMRRTYLVYQYGTLDNVVTVPVGGVEHANQIEAKLADKLTGMTGLDVSGNSASAGVSKGAVQAKLK